MLFMKPDYISSLLSQQSRIRIISCQLSPFHIFIAYTFSIDFNTILLHKIIFPIWFLSFKI